MGRIKHRAKKKRLISRGSIKSAPLWASLKTYGLKRARTHRIKVDKEKHWRRSSKVKA